MSASAPTPAQRKANLTSGQGDALVSVVVGTKNSAVTLRRCLDSVVDQTYRPIEIVLVDNFSTDDTVAIAKEYTDRVYSIGPERSSQYNYAFRAAQGDYIYRIDSDFVLDPRIVREATDCLSRGFDVVLVPDTTDTSVSFWARVRSLEKLCFLDDGWNVAARFFRAPVQQALGGYDEDLVAGEDYDLHNRLLRAGYRVGRILHGEVHLAEPRTLREIWDKHYFYGTTLRAFLERNDDRGVRQVLPVRTSYLRHWRDFVQNPDLAAGFLVYQSVKYIAAWRGWSSVKSPGEPHDGGRPSG
ncbi:MAG: glycosyltransferase [Methanobacteriota archaeon]|nr:MAG: glycosyltransferase [Euryarchaeota archaeon]